MAKDKRFTVLMRPSSGEQTYSDAEGNTREVVRSMTVLAASEDAAKEIAKQQISDLGDGYKVDKVTADD